MMSLRRPLNVFHVIETLGPGGAERLLYTNLKNLDRSQIHSTVITVFSNDMHWAESIRGLGINVISLNCRSNRDFPFGIARLLKFLNKEKPDLIHTHLWSANLIGRVAGRIRGIPVISSIHNPDHEPLAWNDGSEASLTKRQLIKAVDRWTARLGCIKLIAVSRYVQESTYHHLRFPLKKIELLYNPVDVDDLNCKTDTQRQEVVRSLGWSDDSKVLLHVGRISPQKGLIYALRALKKVHQQFPSTKLVSVGGLGDDSWLKKVEQEVEVLQIEPSVRILGPRKQVADLLRACDLFIFPSLFEGLGIALLEAMAIGCACIATRTGPLPEIINHGVDGWLVGARDVDGLAEAISQLLSDQPLRQRLSANASESILSRFDALAAATRLREIYDSVLSQASTKSSVVSE